MSAPGKAPARGAHEGHPYFATTWSGRLVVKGCVVLGKAKIGAGEGFDQLHDYPSWLCNQTDPIAKLATIARD